MMRAFLGAVVLAAGCTFGVDPIEVAFDAMAPPDLPAHVDDLAVLPDLTGNPDLTQLPDLSTSADLTQLPDLTCLPPLFTGFGSGGAVSPFDCTGCGCTIDDFTSFSSARWTSSLPPEWTTSMAAGILTFNTAGSSNTARPTLSSDGKFYLDGDFDLVVDYRMVTWTNGGGANLAALGPANTAPTARAHTFILGGLRHIYLVVDDQIVDAATGAVAGTFEITRTGSTICAGVWGQQMKCRAASETKRVVVTLQNTVDNAACSATCSGAACCAQQVQFKNLKLLRGVIYDSP